MNQLLATSVHITRK